MTLLDEINGKWKTEHEEMVSKWATALDANLITIESAVKRFRVPAPLDVYLTVSRGMNPTPKFSLRFLGQEVGELKISKDSAEVILNISKKQAATNAKHFSYIALNGPIPWDGRLGTEFRKHFKKLDKTIVKVAVPEHRVEAEFLKQMRRGDKGKFSGSLAGIQPVSLAGCRFQFPLPLSASSGAPKDSRGNIDILARRGSGRGTKLSVWELKKPEVADRAIEQAYIYAVTLQKLLRSPSGNFWYQKVFGFKGAVPSKIVIESVAAVSLKSDKKRRKIESEFQALLSSTQFQVGNDLIVPHLVYYDFEPKQESSHLKLSFFQQQN